MLLDDDDDIVSVLATVDRIHSFAGHSFDDATVKEMELEKCLVH